MKNRKSGRASMFRAIGWAAVFAMVIGVASIATQQASAANQVYIRLIGQRGPVDGTSKDAAHMGWISVSSVVAGDLNGDATADRESSAPSVSEATKSNAAPKPNIGSQSSGAGAGKVTAGNAATPPRDAASGMTTGRRMHKPFVITKEVDKASPMLLQAAASGEHFKTVEIDDVANGKTLHYVLSDVMISSVRTSSSSGGERPMESFSLTYQRIEMK